MGRKLWIGLTVGMIFLRAVPGWAATINVPVDYSTIGAANTAATSGDTINVAAGTYTETGQIVISKNLSIVGAGKTSTIIMLDSDTTNSGDGKGWFLINPGNTVNFKDVTLDGSGHKIYQAIRHSGSGTIENVKFTNIKYEESGPQYNGGGVRILGPGNVDVKNCEFSQMGRVGIIDEGGTGTFSGNTYLGKGNGDWLDYAFDIEYGSQVIIDNNQISDNKGVASVDGSESAGISIWDDPGTRAIVTGNTLTNNTIGVAIAVATGSTDPIVTIGGGNIISGGTKGIDIQSWYGALGSPTITITGTTISDSVDGISVVSGMAVDNITVHNSSLLNNFDSGIDNLGTGTLNATDNFWGDSSGPSGGALDPVTSTPASGTGDNVSVNVHFDPWLDAAVDEAETKEIPAATTETIENGELGIGADVTTNAGGSSTVTLAQYSGNPSGVAFDGYYYDLFVSDPGNIDQIILKLYYNELANTEVYWFNDSIWALCSDQEVIAESVTIEGVTYNNRVEVTINNNTTPSLGDLSGTFFALAAPENPTADSGSLPVGPLAAGISTFLVWWKRRKQRQG